MLWPGQAKPQEGNWAPLTWTWARIFLRQTGQFHLATGYFPLGLLSLSMKDGRDSKQRMVVNKP